MDGQEGRGWRERQIQEEEQYLYRETCPDQTFGITFGNAPRKAFGKAFGITRIQGWPVGGEFVFALEGTFIRSFTLKGGTKKYEILE